MRGTRIVVVAVMLGVNLVAARSSADDPSMAETEAKQADAKARSDAMAGRANDAYQAAVRAYALAPNMRRLWNRGVIESEVNRPLEALRDVKRCLAKSSVPARHIGPAHEIVEESYSRLGRIRIRAPEGSALSIDGSRKDVADDALIAPDVETLVAPGPHTVTDGSGHSQRVTVAQSQVVEVDFRIVAEVHSSL